MTNSLMWNSYNANIDAGIYKIDGYPNQSLTQPSRSDGRGSSKSKIPKSLFITLYAVLS